MTLKIHINGNSKKLVTPLRTFINGNLTRLSKGFTFVNGEKVQLWGNTRTQFFSMPFEGGFDNDILYIDDNYMYTYGSTLIGASSSSGGSAVVVKNNSLCVYDISNPTNASRISYVQWGLNPIFSPTESDSGNYVYYITNSNIRNKVNLRDTGSPAIITTYSGQSGMLWCVPLLNGKNLWARRVASQGSYDYYIGYNSTNVLKVYETRTPNPIWDNGNLVVSGTGTIVQASSDSGSNAITNNCYTTSRIMDGNYVVVAGYNTVKIAKYNLTNNSTVWEKTFDADRRVDIIGEGNGKYYVVDKPQDFNATDTNVYLRIYDAGDGQELESSILDFRTESDSRIIGWQTTPMKAVNGILAMRWYNANKMYICKVFVD